MDVLPALNRGVVSRAIALSSLLSFFSKVVSLAASTMTFVVLTPMLYGYWRIALALTSATVGWLTSPSSFLMVEVLRGKDDRVSPEGKNIWRTYVVVSSVFALILMLALLGAAPFLRASLQVPDVRLLLIACLLIPFWVIKSHALTAIQISFNFKKLLFVQVIEGSVYLAALFLFIIKLKLGVLGLGVAQLTTALSGICLTTGPLIGLMGSISWQDLKQGAIAGLIVLKKHGKWAIAFKWLKDATDTLRIWLLNAFLGPTAVGLFSLVDALIGHVSSIVNTLPAFTAALPRYVHDPERLKAATQTAIRYSLLVFWGVFVLSSILIPFAIPWIFPKYSAAIPYYLAMSLILLTLGISSVLTAIFPALGYQRALFQAQAWRFVVTGLNIVLLVRFLGLWVMPLEYVICSFLFLLYRWSYLKKQQNWQLRFYDLLPGIAEIREGVIIIIRQSVYFKKYVKMIFGLATIE